MGEVAAMIVKDALNTGWKSAGRCLKSATDSPACDFARRFPRLESSADLGTPPGCIILLLVQEYPQDVGGDGSTDQGHADLENDVDTELAQPFRQVFKDRLELQDLGQAYKGHTQQRAGPQKQLVDVDRRCYFIDFIPMFCKNSPVPLPSPLQAKSSRRV